MPRDNKFVIILKLRERHRMKNFSYEQLFLMSQGDSVNLLKYFKDHHTKGGDYIQNERIVTDNPLNLEDYILAEYLGLCSLRNYPEKDLSLDLLPPWIPIEVVIENPLIKLKDRTIMFIHEKEIK